MPLLKKKPFSLAEPPQDLDSKDLVYQLRFTKEIFTDYGEYLKRINVYRQRVWGCKVTGKTNLTYEEALVSEKHAAEKVQQLPKELIEPALQIIQFSMLSLKDLADAIGAKLQEHVLVGTEVQAKEDKGEFPCRVLKVIEEEEGKAVRIRYKVARLDRNKKVVDTSTVNCRDLVQKKRPFSRNVLKSFIRESTYRSAPWVVHGALAQKHGIVTELPSALRRRFVLHDGLVLCGNKRKKGEEDGFVNGKREVKEEAIRYPIDDLLVKPGVDDPVFTERPVPSTDFNVPMECVGDLLMVWEFCSSFARLLQLSPYSLEDLENAVCHKKGNVALLVETHSSLIHLLMKDKKEYFLATQKQYRTQKITLVSWTDYLCDVLEMAKSPEIRDYILTIKRGHYGLLDAQAKLGIFRELVNLAVESDTFREKMDECVEERHALGATRREEAIEEARKKRAEKEVWKPESNNGTAENGDSMGKIGDKKSDTLSKKAENGKKLVQREGMEKKSKEQRKEYYEKEMEKRFVRTSPLGKDRDYNRYWWFHRAGKVFVETPDSTHWGYYSTKEEVDAFLGSLNCKGEREFALQRQLDLMYPKIRCEVEKRSKKKELEEAVVRRSTRVRAPPTNSHNPALAFLGYVNHLKEDRL